MAGQNVHTVCVDDVGQLGSCPDSSEHVKQEIHDLGDLGGKLSLLRPVSFRFRDGYWGGPEVLRYGLIAEEVAVVFPELVGIDGEGRPKRVHYERLAPLLLDQLQRHRTEIARQAETIERLRMRLDRLEQGRE